ncbi:carboxypeptidase-like regulatory domain-containing protein [Fulvivirga sediminis]|uniref:Carboxypeptidase-like regulatory domain-containing protein n=1 Tax=Fulvivirga sediminis TaxID=2803949 RepID=A0A937FA54_9BACT|nr:carboxypeptidase-like regulatory domain-containing protein [Fulvivirga sediminis]MBL3658081.1 carboxypeptidase-like regulatory domain-containing protein [Fulvivirga sediminis]
MIILLLTTGLFAYSQNSNIEITGRIIEAESNSAVPFVHVVNKTSNKGVVSNTEGRFWITMDKTDTLVFSSIGFEPYAYTIKENVQTNKIDLTIELNTSTMELQPVKVFAYRDEKALKQAILNMQTPIVKDNETSVMLNTPTRPKWTQPEGGVSIGGPFSAIYNKVSKEAKEKKKLQRYERAYDNQLLAKEKYNKRVVIELTGLPEDKVEDFMVYCELKENFIINSSEYEIAVAVNQCLTKFVELEQKELPKQD